MMNLFNRIQLKRKKVKYGVGLKINGSLMLHGHGEFLVGDNCIITSSSNYNPTDGTDRCHLSTQKSGKLIIGNNVGISNSAITASLMVQIDDNVLIGSGCLISDTDHHPINSYDRVKDISDKIKCLPIHIKENAFIGARSIILKGVTIGKNSVVGAGSVVTKDIPDNEIWAGNPSKFIRKITEE